MSITNGAGTRQPQCQERLDGEAPCPMDDSGDHVQVAFTKNDSGPMDYVIPFVGLLVQKAKVAIGADLTAYAKRPGSAKLTLHAATVPTGKVAVLEGRKVLADGTLRAGSATAAATQKKVTVTSR